MSLEPHCVFDTNVVVSALLFDRSVPGQAFHPVLEDGVVLASQATLVELNEVLARKKFDSYLTRDEREQFLARLVRQATVIAITEQIRECRDPKDDKFLELAVNGSASHLVTGDQDLLVLHPFRDISVLTPAQFLEWMAQERGRR